MKFSILTTILMISSLISMGEVVPWVSSHYESRKVECESDADCVTRGGSCAFTRFEWKIGSKRKFVTSNDMDTCTATAKCGTKSKEKDDEGK